MILTTIIPETGPLWLKAVSDCYGPAGECTDGGELMVSVVIEAAEGAGLKYISELGSTISWVGTKKECSEAVSSLPSWVQNNFQSGE